MSAVSVQPIRVLVVCNRRESLRTMGQLGASSGKTGGAHSICSCFESMKTTLNFLLLLGGYCFSQGHAADALASSDASTTTNSGVPRIQFALTTKDFGKLRQGETVKHEFVFTNTGTAMLLIKDVKPGCGCTTAGRWDTNVEPGKVGVIPLQFNSSGFSGPISKSATVTCNDPVQTNIVLHLNGTVWKPIDITPQIAMFQINADVQTNQTKTLRVVNNLEEPVTLSELKSGNTNFAAELKEIKPGKEFELHVTALAPFSNSIPATAISFKTSLTQAPLMSVTAYAIVRQPVVVSPPQIYLPAGPLTNLAKPVVTVASATTNTLKVSEPKLDLPGVEVNVREVQTGRVFVVETKFPVGFKLEPGTRAVLTLKTDNPRFPVVSVPVYQSQALGPAGVRPVGPVARPVSVNISQPVGAAPASRAIPLRNPGTSQ